jgi:hypothetical protein
MHATERGLKSLAIDLGADLVGIATAEALADAPPLPTRAIFCLRHDRSFLSRSPSTEKALRSSSANNAGAPIAKTAKP